MQVKLHGYSSEELFRVDRPEDALKALCYHKAELLSWDSLREAYEKVNKEKVTLDYASIVGMFFNQFGLIEEASIPHKYRINKIARDICRSLAEGDLSHYRELLTSTLLGQELKSKLFRRFLTFVSKPRTFSEVNQEFERKGTTLKAWCEEAGLIAQRGEQLWSIKPSIRSTDQFWEKLSEVYRELTRTRMPGVRSSFVRISEAKTQMLPFLPPEDPESFEEFLLKALKEPRYKSRLELSGAPISYVDREKLDPFVYQKKNYYFISVLGK